MNKKELTSEQKLQILRKRHQESPIDVKRTIEDWETEMINLQFKADWIRNENTVRLCALVRAQVAKIENKLATVRNIDETDRKLLFDLKNAHMVYLAVLTDDPEEEISMIENNINEEI